MECPQCGAPMSDVTGVWHTFAESQGAEYLAAYVTIWRCPRCDTVIGADDETVKWVMEPEIALSEE